MILKKAMGADGAKNDLVVTSHGQASQDLI